MALLERTPAAFNLTRENVALINGRLVSTHKSKSFLGAYYITTRQKLPAPPNILVKPAPQPVQAHKEPATATATPTTAPQTATATTAPQTATATTAGIKAGSAKPTLLAAAGGIAVAGVLIAIKKFRNRKKN